MYLVKIDEVLMKYVLGVEFGIEGYKGEYN